MCGIAGFYDRTQIKNQSAELCITEMLYKIRHRGPDFTDHKIIGSMVLGHNRLSIIDLNPRSHQPFKYGPYTITYNGEVYNYIELRETLKKANYTFSTDSDTEVIIKAYEHWGVHCLDHFVGMWAFAIWDESKQELFCARDRFGIKPFYYIADKDAFYFASEMNALKQTPVFKNEINIDQLNRSIQLKWTSYKSETIFKNISQLEPRHYILFRPGQNIEQKRYWDLSEITHIPKTLDEYIHSFKETFANSVKIHLRSDVAIGGCLSGGLDSSAIASVIGKNHPTLNYQSFTIYYDDEGDVDERPYVHELLQRFPNIHGHFENPSDGTDLMDSLLTLAKHADVPIMGSSYLSQHYLMRIASENGVKVILDGQGSDEYLLGYMQSYYRIIADLWGKGKLSKGLSILNAQAKRQGYNSTEIVKRLLKSILSLFMNEHRLFSLAYRNYCPFIGLHEYKNNTPFELKDIFDNRTQNHLYHKLYHTEMQDLLHFEDRNSMCFSLESRVPYLDHRLVELGFHIESENKVQDGISKYILREATKEYLPYSIYARQDKKGFVTPGEVKWLRGPLKELITHINYSNLNMLNTKKIKEIIDDYQKGSNKNAELVWRIALFNQWLSLNQN